MTKSPPEGISVGPKDDNLFVWEVLIVGPPGTMLYVQLPLCSGLTAGAPGF
jgi:ubiquitin-protein ligase